MTLYFDILKIKPLSSRDDLPCRQLHGRCKVSRSRRCTAPVWWILLIFHDHDDDEDGDDDGFGDVGDVWWELLTYISLSLYIISYHCSWNCWFIMIMTTMVAMMTEMRPSWRRWQPPKTDPNHILLLIIFLQGSLNAFSHIILQRLACKLIWSSWPTILLHLVQIPQRKIYISNDRQRKVDLDYNHLLHRL